jgi:hypothetical protein
MSPNDLDRLSSAELKSLIVQQQEQMIHQSEQIVELQRLVVLLCHKFRLRLHGIRRV